MRLHVKAYASLRHYLPDRCEDLDLDLEGPLPVAALLDLLHIPDCEVMVVKVGERIVKKDHVPGDGDRVEILPILSGG